MKGFLKDFLWNAETWFQPPEGVNLMFQDNYKIGNEEKALRRTH